MTMMMRRMKAKIPRKWMLELKLKTKSWLRFLFSRGHVNMCIYCSACAPKFPCLLGGSELKRRKMSEIAPGVVARAPSTTRPHLQSTNLPRRPSTFRHRSMAQRTGTGEMATRSLGIKHFKWSQPLQSSESSTHTQAQGYAPFQTATSSTCQCTGSTRTGSVFSR
jgi:hypothetical protein